MAVPVIIFIVCFCAGAVTSGQILPDLAAGSVGGLAFFIVCGLLGAALGLVGLHTYLILDALKQSVGSIPGVGDFKATTVAHGLDEILLEAGVLVGLAAGVYLLSPPPFEESEDHNPGSAA
ncbi:MAG: hypothetical protein H0X28_01105 [Solirubrobacterales bacterium]|nr:hypothetical protein [Solirubrobacterales bacterium]